MCGKAKSLDLLYPEPNVGERSSLDGLDGGLVVLELDVARLVAEVRVGVDRLQVVDQLGVDGGDGGFEPSAGSASATG